MLTQPSSPVPLRSDLELGHPTLDEEHRVQFALIDAVAEAVAAGLDAAEVDRSMARLIEYVRAHFLSEQLLMERHRYPGREAHAREHDQAIELLEDLERRHRVDVTRWTLDSIHLLRDWLAGHVRGADRSLVMFLEAGGSTAPRA
jgi:hemerythrin-like metal-binding protein